MRTWIIASLAGVTLVFAIWAQDGPNSQSSETVAKPRKKAADTNAPSTSDGLPTIPSKLSPKATKDNDTGGSDANFKADASVVNVDVQVIDNHGNPIPQLSKGNFRILEDNVPQTITEFSTTEAPLTVAMVIEFSNRYQAYYSSGWFQTLNMAYGFIQSLKPDDYVAVITYDMRTTILSDFSNDRTKTMQAMQMLRIPGMAESNMFDALADTADRMSKIEGRKAVLLISSGIDTFSKLTYDKARKALQEAGVPIYAIEMLQIQFGGPIEQLDYLQGDNELKTFAKETGGQAYFPRFIGELSSVFENISHSLRNQYSLGYSPNNQAHDGKFRKLTVQIVDPKTNEPLRMLDEKGKPMKYTILAKTGYKAPREVE